MKALVCKAFGPLDDLEIDAVAVPQITHHEVLVRVHSCGLNFPDVLLVEGRYQRRPPLPFTPGTEFAGTVAAAGAPAGGRIGARHGCGWRGGTCGCRDCKGHGCARGGGRLER
jgi:NADPH:quinone reductase-like Zn-dependent oxidoreductase